MEVPKDKFILDATAGYRMMWENKHHPNTLYIDQRSECAPDEVQDFRKLPYPNDSFQLIIFDPPHKKRPLGMKSNGILVERYGALCSDSWFSDLKQGFKELWRVLKPNGVLVFKWNDDDVRIPNLEKAFPTEPLVRQIVKNAQFCPYGKSCSRRSKPRYASKTYWFTFMKLPDFAFSK